MRRTERASANVRCPRGISRPRPIRKRRGRRRASGTDKCVVLPSASTRAIAARHYVTKVLARADWFAGEFSAADRLGLGKVAEAVLIGEEPHAASAAYSGSSKARWFSSTSKVTTK